METFLELFACFGSDEAKLILPGFTDAFGIVVVWWIPGPHFFCSNLKRFICFGLISFLPPPCLFFAIPDLLLPTMDAPLAN